MSKLACWTNIKDGCNAAQQDALAAAQFQADALYYEDELATALSTSDQQAVQTLAEDTAKAANVYRKKAERLRAFMQEKAFAAEAGG